VKELKLDGNSQKNTVITYPELEVLEGFATHKLATLAVSFRDPQKSITNSIYTLSALNSGKKEA